MIVPRRSVPRRVRSSQLIQWLAVQHRCPDQPLKLRQASNRALSTMRELDQHEGDQRHRNLDAHGVLAGAVEVPQLQRLLDPAKEQLDIPYKTPLKS